MLERRDPFNRMLSLRQMMDRLMEDAFVMPRDALMSGLGALTGGGQMDVYEEGNNFVVEAQLPGFRPEDIDISVERGTLTIRGESRAQEERKDRNYLVREQRTGSFQRAIQLPQAVDPDACQATFEHGILRLTFPKAEQAQPRRIPISVGGQSGGSAQGIGVGQGGGALGASGGSATGSQSSRGAGASGGQAGAAAGSTGAGNESTGMGGAAGDAGPAGGAGTSSGGSPATPEGQARSTAQ